MPSPSPEDAVPLEDPPSPFACEGYRAYLERWFAWKNQQERYSYRDFAREAGLEKSPAVLRNVIKGLENLGPPRVTCFLSVLQLPAEEEAYFRVLVTHDQAEKTPVEQARLAVQLAALREEHARGLAVEDARRVHESRARRFIERWYCSVILDLSARSDFRADPAWLVTAFDGRITAEQADEGLSILRSLGMILPDGRRAPTLPRLLFTPGVAAGAAALAFHRDVHALEAALLHPDATPLHADSEFKTRSRFLAATFLLRDTDREALYSYLAAAQEEILTRFDHADGEQGVAVSLRLFPLTAVLPDPNPDDPRQGG